jgi:hypothetical protein
MATGRNNYQARTKPHFVAKMRELGYMVEQQQETLTMLMGLLVSQAEEIELLKGRAP